MKKKKFVTVAFSALSLTAMCNTAFAYDTADEKAAQSVMMSVAQSNKLFGEWQNAETVFDVTISTDEMKIYDVCLNGKTDGYIVLNNLGKLLCYSLDENVSSETLELIQPLVTNQEETTENNNLLTTSSTYYNVLSGLNPQLQDNSNCIVAAASNVMWYYSQNGFSSLVGSDTFTTVKGRMAYCYSQNGGFANNNTPDAVADYVYLKAPSLQSSVLVKWNPTIYMLCSEIDNGRPVMLGYAAGSTFSSTAGHMTMGCGYQYLNSSWYVYVATGWSTAPTFIQWDSTINDCMILIRLS